MGSFPPTGRQAPENPGSDEWLFGACAFTAKECGYR